MGKKKSAKKTKNVLLPVCYYCEREFEDEKVLMQHQKAKHFKCSHCPRKLNTAGGLAVHIQQVHKLEPERLENTLPGRDGYDVEIFGMEGFPKDILTAYRRRKEEELGLEPGSTTAKATPAAQKRQKISLKPLTEQELQAQLAVHKALMSGAPPPPPLNGFNGSPYAMPPPTGAPSFPQPPFPAFSGQPPPFRPPFPGPPPGWQPGMPVPPFPPANFQPPQPGLTPPQFAPPGGPATGSSPLPPPLPTPQGAGATGSSGAVPPDLSAFAGLPPPPPGWKPGMPLPPLPAGFQFPPTLLNAIPPPPQSSASPAPPATSVEGAGDQMVFNGKDEVSPEEKAAKEFEGESAGTPEHGNGSGRKRAAAADLFD